MPRLKILREFSYKKGKELLKRKHPFLLSEIKQIFATTEIGEKSKISKERNRAGQLVWSGKDLRPLKTSFKIAGWKKERIKLSPNNFVEIDLVKEKVGLNLQFGKYSFVDTDFVKFEIFYLKKRLEIGIEVVPTKIFQAEMYSGPPNFDQVVARLKARGNISPVPLIIWGVSPFG